MVPANRIWPIQFFSYVSGSAYRDEFLESFCGLLDGSGWPTLLSKAKVATQGIADSCLVSSDLDRTRYVYQVTVVLAIFQRDAWVEAISADPNNETSFETWKKKMVDNSPTFQYWDIILEVELLIQILVHAHRTGNFDSYVEILEEIAPWFFALARTNYARWIPVHMREMKLMPDELKVEFSKYWVVQKTVNRFSLIPIDQYHEQNNAILKGEGGMKGLAENPNTFRKWAVAAPEQCRLIKEFESTFLNMGEQGKGDHHSQSVAVQNRFK